MSEELTTIAVQRYLDALDHAPEQDDVIRDLLGRAFGRLQKLCGSLLHHSYSRLTQAPLQLTTGELLSGVMERLLKALRQVRPAGVRQFFALANRHIRWELNDLARRLDEQTTMHELADDLATPESSGSGLSQRGRRILEAIENLPDDEREVFDLVRIQGLPNGETAAILGVSAKTVQRRLHRALVLLAERLNDLAPE
jgi:RNA polymerase sigma factor (sigma-70 family)